MKVLFLKDAPGQGKAGEVKEIAGGFAKNYLIPKGFAKAATAQLEILVKSQQAESQRKQEKQMQRWGQLKVDLEKRSFTVLVKTGDRGQIFGGLNEKTVLAIINEKMGTDFDRHQLSLPHTIKSVGEQFATLKFGHGVEAKIKINIQAQT